MIGGYRVDEKSDEFDSKLTRPAARAHALAARFHHPIEFARRCLVDENNQVADAPSVNPFNTGEMRKSSYSPRLRYFPL